jgi:hypothetical protein
VASYAGGPEIALGPSRRRLGRHHRSVLVKWRLVKWRLVKWRLVKWRLVKWRLVKWPRS